MIYELIRINLLSLPLRNTIDLDLLEEIQKTVTKIIFVFNKADLVGEEDLQKLILHNKNVLAEILQKDIE